MNIYGVKTVEKKRALICHRLTALILLDININRPNCTSFVLSPPNPKNQCKNAISLCRFNDVSTAQTPADHK